MARCCGKYTRKGKYCKDCPLMDGVSKKKRKKMKSKAEKKHSSA